MTNPFHDENGTFIVLVNDEGQYTLWPTVIDLPAGWITVHEPAGRQVCLDYISQTWADMRLVSLLKQLSQRRAPRAVQFHA
jgi:MbtH protein